MATTQYNAASQGFHVADRVLAAFDGIKAAICQSRDYHRTVAALSKLNDRELDDLGLNSYDIKSAARKIVYGA